MAPSSDYIIEFKIDVFKTLKLVGITTGVLTAIGVGAYYINRQLQSSKRVILRDEVRNILRPFQLTEEQIRRVMANLNTEMTNGLKSDDTATNDLAMFPTYVHHGPSGQESGEYLVVDLGGSNFRVSHVVIEARNRMRLNNKIFLIPHSLLLGEGEKLFDYIAECLQRFIDDNKLSLHKSADGKFDLAFTFSFPCKQTSLREATLVSWTKGFSCTSVVGNDVVLMLQQAINRRKGLKIEVVALVNDTVGTLMACSSTYRDCRAGVILGTGTNACYFEHIENVPKWTGLRDNTTKQIIISTEWGALGKNGCLDFIRTDIDRELDESSLTPQQQVFEKMISALYLGEIVRLIIVDLVQRSILFPGRMQKSPSIRPDYNIFLILRGSFYAKHVADIESDTTEDLSITATILTSIGIHEPSYDDCYIIREVCKTVSLRAAKLAAAAIAVLINRLNMPSVTVAVDGTLFRHHQKFKKNLIRTLDRLVPRTHRLVLSEDGSSKGSALVAAVDRRLKTASATYEKNLESYGSMDGLYLPDGRHLALIDRDWIVDELPHLGNPDDNSDANYLLASAAAANCNTSIVPGSSTGRTTSTIGTGTSSSHGASPHTGSGTSRTVDSTGATSGSTGVNHHGTGVSHHYPHNLSYNPDEFESDLTLLSEIVDETQNKWSDFGLNQLLTSYARSNRPVFK